MIRVLSYTFLSWFCPILSCPGAEQTFEQGTCHDLTPCQKYACFLVLAEVVEVLRLMSCTGVLQRIIVAVLLLGGIDLHEYRTVFVQKNFRGSSHSGY